MINKISYKFSPALMLHNMLSDLSTSPLSRMLLLKKTHMIFDNALNMMLKCHWLLIWKKNMSVASKNKKKISDSLLASTNKISNII